MIAPI